VRFGGTLGHIETLGQIFSDRDLQLNNNLNRLAIGLVQWRLQHRDCYFSVMIFDYKHRNRDCIEKWSLEK
jgi:hypothetical protein